MSAPAIDNLSPTLRRLQTMEEGLADAPPRIVDDPPHIVNNFGQTETQRIILAAGAGNVEEILRHERAVVQAVRDTDELSPLHIAVRAGHENVVDALLSFSAQTGDRSAQFTSFDFLHAQTRKGYTAIHFAVISGNESVLRLLIREYGVVTKRPECEWDFADEYWMTPLHYAVLGNHEKVMQQLLEWKDYDRHVNARDYFQRTPLHLASYHRPVRVDELLRYPGVDVNAKDCLSLTPLHWAVYFGRTDVVRCLVRLHRDPKSSRKNTIQAVCRDIGDRTVLEISMEDRLLNLRPSISDKPCLAPFDHDKWFLREEAATIHREVNFEIEKLLLTCSDVSTGKEDLDKNLGIYVNAINAILLMAALIASAAISMSTDSLNTTSKSHFLQVFFVLNFISFYGSVATVLLGATILQPLGKSVPIARRVKYARFSLSITSMMVGFSLCFFLASFYAQNAARVGEDKTVTGLRISYYAASGVAVILCFAFVIYFIQLHQHMRHIFSELHFNKERIKMWSESVGIVMTLFLLFFLEKLCFRKLHIADRVVERYVASYGRTGQKRQILDKAEKLFDAHMELEHSPLQDFSEIRTQIESAYRGAWKSTRMGNFGAGRRRQEMSHGLTDKYWQRHNVSSRDRKLFQRIQKEIVHMERAYRRLAKKRGIGRQFVCFLDLLPHGLFFWLDDWIMLWKTNLAIFYCGHMLEEDATYYERIQKGSESDD